MLSAVDPLPQRPRRIVIAGVSGTGKTTLARRVAAITGVPHTEIDALFHGAGWTPRPEFLGDVRALVAGDTWITEWQYGDARPLIAERMDLLVWLDLPFWRVTFPGSCGAPCGGGCGASTSGTATSSRRSTRSSATPSTSSGGPCGRGTHTATGFRRWPPSVPTS